MIPDRKPTTDVDGFIERVEADLAAYEAREADLMRRRSEANITIVQALLEDDAGRPELLLRLAESDTRIARIADALRRGDHEAAARICVEV